MQIDTTVNYSPHHRSDHSLPEFIFPIRKEMLCDQPADSRRFYVQYRTNISALNENQIKEVLEKVSQSFCSSKSCLNIQFNEVFDILFSLLYYLEEIHISLRKDLILYLNTGLRHFEKQIEKTRILTQENYHDHRRSMESGISRGHDLDMNKFRNALKCYIYLVTTFLQDNSRHKESKDVPTKKRKNNKNNKNVDQA